MEAKVKHYEVAEKGLVRKGKATCGDVGVFI